MPTRAPPRRSCLPSSSRWAKISTPTRSSPFECTHCNGTTRVFKSQEALVEHYRGSPFHENCPSCGKGFVNQSALTAHRASEHPIVECTSCGSTEAKTLEDHYKVSQAHPSCMQCAIGFLDADTLGLHNDVAHPIVICQLCGPAEALTLLEHYRASAEHPRCLSCDGAFFDAVSLRMHRVAEHSEVDCDLCGTVEARCLQKHYESSPYHPDCRFCGDSFVDENHLRAHHTDRHPRVDCPNCGDVSGRTLEYHYERSPLHPKCRLCGIGTLNNQTLKNHQVQVHPMLFCLLCGTIHENMTSHVKAMHPRDLDGLNITSDDTNAQSENLWYKKIAEPRPSRSQEYQGSVDSIEQKIMYVTTRHHHQDQEVVYRSPSSRSCGTTSSSTSTESITTPSESSYVGSSTFRSPVGPFQNAKAQRILSYPIRDLNTNSFETPPVHTTIWSTHPEKYTTFKEFKLLLEAQPPPLRHSRPAIGAEKMLYSALKVESPAQVAPLGYRATRAEEIAAWSFWTNQTVSPEKIRSPSPRTEEVVTHKNQHQRRVQRISSSLQRAPRDH